MERAPCGPISPCGPTANMEEAPTAIALDAKIAITIPAINLPIVIETAAIFLTSENTLLLQIAFNNFSILKI
jgi:hypothetical protein